MKQVRSKFTCLNCLLFLMAINTLLAQRYSEDSLEYHSIVSLQDSSLIHTLQSHGLLDNIDFREILPGSLSSILQQVQEEQSKLSLYHTQTQLRWNNYYTDFDSLMDATIDPFQSQMQLRQSFRLGALPLLFRSNLIYRDQQIDTRLSNFAIHFDTDTYLHNRKRDLLQQFTLKNILQQKTQEFKEVPSLDKEASQYLSNEIQFRLYHKILSDPAYHTIKDSLEAQVAVLGQDTLADMDPVNARLDSLRLVIDQFNEAYKHYNEAWEKKTRYPSDVYKMIAAQEERYLSQLNALNDPRHLKSVVAERTDNWKEKLALWTRHFDIGLFQLQGSAFTTQRLSLTGIRYGWQGKSYFGEAAYGTQSFNANFFPSLAGDLFDRFKGRKMLQLSAGIGDGEADHFKVSFLRATQGQQNKSFIYAKQNTVVSLSGTRRVSQDFELNAELAFGHHDLVNSNLEGTNRSITSDQSALEITLNYQPRSKLDLGLGYFYIGPNFISLGNPFLLTNRQGLLLEAKTTFFEVLKIDLNSKLGRSIQPIDQFATGLSDLQLTGGVNWRFSKNSSLDIRIAPNTFQQTGTGHFNISSNAMLYQAQAIFNSPLKSGDLLLSIAGYSNFRSTLNYFDTTAVDQSHYIFCEESYLLTNGQSINASATLGVQDGAINETFTQVDYQLGLKRWNIGLGGQLLQDRFDGLWRYGLTGNLSTFVSDKISCSLFFIRLV